MEEPPGNRHLPIVHLPAHVPPPITISESGYPIGIAGANGSPAWARPPGVIEASDHPHHNHARHYRHQTPSAIPGPRYLIPMGTPVPNPYGPGVVFIPPPNARVIPCMPVSEVPFVDFRDDDDYYDELGTIRFENNNHCAASFPLGSGNHGNQYEEDIYREFARMRLQAEQTERFRMEEFERTQGLWDAHHRESERQRQTVGTVYGRNSEYASEAGSGHRQTPRDNEKIIQIHIRHPCRKCQEAVIVETQTVHHRFPSQDLNKRVGINVDSPAVRKSDRDVICERCQTEEEEENRQTELMRKVLREVIDENQHIQKRRPDAFQEAILHSSCNHLHIATDTTNNQPDSDHRGKHTKHRNHIRHEPKPTNKYPDNTNSESETDVKAQIKTTKSILKANHKEIHPVFSVLDENQDGNYGYPIREPSNDEDEIPYYRIRQGRDKKLKPSNHTQKHGLTDPVKQSPAELFDAVIRGFKVSKDRKHHKKANIENVQEIASSSSSSEYEYTRERGYTANINTYEKKSYPALDSRSPQRHGSHTRDTSPQHSHSYDTPTPTTHHGKYHRHHYKDSSSCQLDNVYAPVSKDKRISGHHRPSTDLDQTREFRYSDDNKPGFLTGWSMFNKATF
ncbi:hypothetical protein H072_9030 [Dactylellina haptotyla CBS 200.50]|uniref:Uncharacterized protein n=1 Tax=Dactylellina haptotyla (strain CBS 200.50) TaxID=1284197 RepID=S8A829_DACHA|nr:hypothetical protein H072_9030 [Dactylellina haptotyla CBS 200.50]